MNELTPQVETYLKDWGITIALAGAICAFLGAFAGWIIWRNTRRFTQQVEDETRDALADYERTSDEISLIQAELSEDTNKS